MTQESEQEQRRRIPEMEKDVFGIDNLQASCDETVIPWIYRKSTKCKLEDLEALKELCDELEEESHRNREYN